MVGALLDTGGALVITLRKSPGFELDAPNNIVLLAFEISHQSPSLPFLCLLVTLLKTPL